MRVEDLLKPIAPDAPCGEDLLAADDPDFVDYYFNVEERLPTSYFNVLRGEVFDPKSVDHKAETAQIEALLKRSRDLRLLGLEAKFQILAGRFKGFAEAVLGMAALIETYPAEVNPTDPVDRKNALEELNSLATIVAPLEYAVLFNDRRAGDMTFRAYATGTGKIALREGETAGDAGVVGDALGSGDNAKTVEELHASLTALRAALESMAVVCQSGSPPFTPKYDRLDDKLADILAMVQTARADLAGGGQDPAIPQPGAEKEEQTAMAPGANAGAFVVQVAVGDVTSHRAAYQLLQTVERYFATTEPASLALVLVTQSRLLIGRPLVEALDALISNSADSATIKFGTDSDFKISMSRMRELSELSDVQPTTDWGEKGEDEPEYPVVVSREHAGQVLKQIEDFFRLREPASPIPILLFKARSMLGKDFSAIVRDLIPES